MALQPADSQVVGRWWTLAVALALVLASCTEAEVDDPVPDEAVPVGVEALSSDALVAVADLQPGDQLFQMPAGGRYSVLVRVRDGEPPLMFATSCDVVSSTPLPGGWQGICLEYTSDGQRVQGQFPWGTTSIGT